MTSIGLVALLLAFPVSSAVQSHKLSFDGLAPVKIGMTVGQVERVLHAELTIEYPNDDGPAGCAIASLKGRNVPFSYLIENGRVTRVDLGGAGVRSFISTARGIGLGSGIGAIRRAYGKQAQSHPNVYDETEPVFEIKSADGKAAMLFETEHGRVVRIHVGRLPSAEYIEGCL